MTSQDIAVFIEEHIKDFNNNQNDFKKTTPNGTQIKDFLRQRFLNACKESDFQTRVLEQFKNYNYKENKIVDIANQEILYKADIKRFLEMRVFIEISQKIQIQNLQTLALEHIKNSLGDENKFKFIENKLSKILEKSLFIATINGFSANLLHINSGVMMANAGDSAQFLFIARAILAGFNASNVDVRSSRYDAIVDYENILLRIQVKGISSGNISFKDRDRGGQGIDHTHDRNKGKRITSKDCDIYVAVDKQVGICYIIPMSYADTLSDYECKNVNLKQLEKYKENWEIIKEVALLKK